MIWVCLKRVFFSIFSELTNHSRVGILMIHQWISDIPTYPASSLIFSATSIGPIGYDGKVMEHRVNLFGFPSGLGPKGSRR